MLGDALGVVDIVDGAATMLLGTARLEFGETTLIPELHSQSNDRATLFREEGSHDGAVDATAHGDGDEGWLGYGGTTAGAMVLDGLECGGHVRKLIRLLYWKNRQTEMGDAKLRCWRRIA